MSYDIDNERGKLSRPVSSFFFSFCQKLTISDTLRIYIQSMNKNFFKWLTNLSENRLCAVCASAASILFWAGGVFGNLAKSFLLSPIFWGAFYIFIFSGICLINDFYEKNGEGIHLGKKLYWPILLAGLLVWLESLAFFLLTPPINELPDAIFQMIVFCGINIVVGPFLLIIFISELQYYRIPELPPFLQKRKKQ